MEKNNTYEFIGQLALCLYSGRITITLSSLNSILEERGMKYDSNRGLASAVSAAYRYWEEKEDLAIRHAIAHTFVDRNRQPAWKKD